MHINTPKRFLFLSILLFLSIGENTEALSKNPSGNMDDLAKTLVTYFPKVTGTVVSIASDQVEIQTQNESGLSLGVLLSVYQPGAPFYHPITKAVLGHFEEEMGELEVIGIEPGRVTARMIKTGAQMVPGSLVRLSAAKILAIVVSHAPKENVQERFLVTEFASALAETGRFTVETFYSEETSEAIPSDKNAYWISFSASAHSSGDSGASSNRISRFYTLHIQMKNLKTRQMISEISADLQASDASDSIVESLQYRLFERHGQ
jgi:hypothetical protein